MDLKNADKCILCKDVFKSAVVLPCKHVGCFECLENFRTNYPDSNCPNDKCKVALPLDLKTNPKLKKDLTNHSKFREGLNKFFTQFLQKIVFKAQLPNEKIIEQLLEFVIHKKIKDTTKKTTKMLSPFAADDIDSTPVIRSFVLKLILREILTLRHIKYITSEF